MNDGATRFSEHLKNFYLHGIWLANSKLRGFFVCCVES